MPDDNSSMRWSSTSDDNLRLIRGDTCLFSSLKIDGIPEFPTIGHQLPSFKLFWQFPVERLQMEVLSHQIHVGDNLWILKSDAFGGCVLQCLIHQGQNGLHGLQKHPHVDQAFRFRALSSGSEAIAAAAAKWVIGIKSECAGLAPVTVDTLHVHLTSALPSLIHTGTFFGHEITGCIISPRPEAVAEVTVGVVPVT